jgi:hypothetical protein
MSSSYTNFSVKCMLYVIMQIRLSEKEIEMWKVYIIIQKDGWLMPSDGISSHDLLKMRKDASISILMV